MKRSVCLIVWFNCIFILIILFSVILSPFVSDANGKINDTRNNIEDDHLLHVNQYNENDQTHRRKVRLQHKIVFFRVYKIMFFLFQKYLFIMFYQSLVFVLT